MQKKPEIIVFAGPNGSGKSMITQLAKVIKPYINADEIQRALGCDNMEAAEIADKLRREHIANNDSFTFETVLSTDRNLKLFGKIANCLSVTPSAIGAKRKSTTNKTTLARMSPMYQRSSSFFLMTSKRRHARKWYIAKLIPAMSMNMLHIYSR